MKTLRIIGSVVGSLLVPMIAILLCAMILLFSAANLITDNMISSVVRTSMENESIQASIGDLLLGQMPIAEGMNSNTMQNVVSSFMSKPAVQDKITVIVQESVEEVTGGNFDGTLDLEEKIAESLLSDPEAVKEIASDLTGVIMTDEALIATVIPPESEIGIVFSYLDEDTKESLLADEDVHAMVSDMITVMITNTLEPNRAQTIDVAKKIQTLVEENPALIEQILNSYMPDEESKNAVIADLKLYADSIGAAYPEENLSQIEFASYLVDLYYDKINADINLALGFSQAAPHDLDYTDFFDPKAAAFSQSSSGAAITFDEETTEKINSFSSYLSIFRSKVFLALTIIFLILFYFLMVLFTWDFRTPLIFTGITSVITGLLLFVIGILPVQSLLSTINMGEYDDLIQALVQIIWIDFSEALMIAGLISLIAGIIMILGFVLFRIYAKKNYGRSTDPAVIAVIPPAQDMPSA